MEKKAFIVLDVSICVPAHWYSLLSIIIFEKYLFVATLDYTHLVFFYFLLSEP